MNCPTCGRAMKDIRGIGEMIPRWICNHTNCPSHHQSQRCPQFVFPEGFTDRDEWEMERKGFVYAFLECEDGRRYQVMFIDPVRLAQDVEATLKSGQHFYYEFGQVVVPEVTIPALTKVIPQLVEEGYLERHKSVRESEAQP